MQDTVKSPKAALVRLLLFLVLIALAGTLYYQTYTLQKKVNVLDARLNEVNHKLLVTPEVVVTPTETPGPNVKVTVTKKLK